MDAARLSLTALGIALVTASALTHTAWNLRAKKIVPTTEFFLAANTAGALLLLPILVATGAIRFLPSREMLPFFFASVGFEALYYASLARAYRTGDLSSAYPVAKGLPVILVALIAWLAFDQRVRLPFYVSGILAIALGILLIAARRGAATGGARPPQPWLWVGLAALGTSGYTLCDGAAMARIPRHGEVPPALLTLDYLFLVAILTSMLLGIIVAAKRRRAGTKSRESWGWKDALFVGAGIQGAYGLVLLSMLYLPNPAVVIALRQLSLPMTLAASAWFVKERASAIKWVGTGCILAGVVAVKWA